MSPKVPSVLGGFRPQVRDAAADVVRRVRYLQAEVTRLGDKLSDLQRDLAAAKAEREAMQQACGHCDNCSACVG